MVYPTTALPQFLSSDINSQIFYFSLFCFFLGQQTFPMLDYSYRKVHLSFFVFKPLFVFLHYLVDFCFKDVSRIFRDGDRYDFGTKLQPHPRNKTSDLWSTASLAELIRYCPAYSFNEQQFAKVFRLCCGLLHVVVRWLSAHLLTPSHSSNSSHYQQLFCNHCRLTQIVLYIPPLRSFFSFIVFRLPIGVVFLSEIVCLGISERQTVIADSDESLPPLFWLF